MKRWTVQCGHAAHYAMTVTVEAQTLEAALDQAITKANGEPNWQRLDQLGPTFVAAVAEGATADPWNGTGSAIPFPARFRQDGEPPALKFILHGGLVQDLRVEHGPIHLSLRDYDIETVDAENGSMHIDELGRRYLLREWSFENPTR